MLKLFYPWKKLSGSGIKLLKWWIIYAPSLKTILGIMKAIPCLKFSWNFPELLLNFPKIVLAGLNSKWSIWHAKVDYFVARIRFLKVSASKVECGLSSERNFWQKWKQQLFSIFRPLGALPGAFRRQFLAFFRFTSADGKKLSWMMARVCRRVAELWVQKLDLPICLAEICSLGC